MLIDFALEAERQRGLSPFEAIHEACMERFRPIMMTTMAALFGALPLALAFGTGAELRWPTHCGHSASNPIAQVVMRLGERATLVMFPAADHSFHTAARSRVKQKQIMAGLLDAVAEWIRH
jgi:hypothetical protein